MSELPYALHYYVPYVRPFRLWKWGPRYALLDGRYVDDGWKLDRYGRREITREQAERFLKEREDV